VRSDQIANERDIGAIHSSATMLEKHFHADVK
jgi:hypothetical protein